MPIEASAVVIPPPPPTGAPKVWMQHVGLVGGPVLVSQEQFDEIYSVLGWTTASAPAGDQLIARVPVHFDGTWAPSTQYAKGALVVTPDGGLMIAYQDQVSDTSFSETGFTRLPGSGSTSLLAF